MDLNLSIDQIAKKPKLSRVYSEKEREEIIDMVMLRLSEGMTIKAACADAGVPDKTYRSWRDKDEEIAMRETESIGRYEGHLIAELEGTKDKAWQRYAWLLERRFTHWRERKQVDVRELTDRQLMEAIEQLSQGETAGGSQEARTPERSEDVFTPTRVIETRSSDSIPLSDKVCQDD